MSRPLGGAPVVELLGRPGCHLCEQAHAVLERVRSRVPFTLQEVDIERDEALFKAYLERIPVVRVDGEEAFQFFVSEAALERILIAGGVDEGVRVDRT